jgi:hypothetical protein
MLRIQLDNLESCQPSDGTSLFAHPPYSPECAEYEFSEVHLTREGCWSGTPRKEEEASPYYARSDNEGVIL